MRLVSYPPLLLLLLAFPLHATVAGVQRFRVGGSGSKYLYVEVLSDSLFHFEASERSDGPDPARGIFTSPMILDQSQLGPTQFSRNGDVIETSRARLAIERASLCVEITDLKKGLRLTRICPEDLGKDTKTLRLDRAALRNAYGVGNFFYDPTTADGDWAGRVWQGAGLGNVRMDFNGAAPSMSQFPIAYFLGQGQESVALFVDSPYRMSWDFTGARDWLARTWGDQLRYYVFVGDDLASLRSQYMDLVGRPILPPKSTFGLWVSEFGYDNWQEIRDDLSSLRANGIPVDGFGLDLQWFGGTFGDAQNARMGSLEFDSKRFPDPRKNIRELREKDGIRLMAIEESYVDARLPEWGRLLPWNAADLPFCYVARTDFGKCTPVLFGSPQNPKWWGYGGMIDWSNPLAGKAWHELKRHELSKLGITSHWTDLGEPEMYNGEAYYQGIPGLPSKNRHGDIHNLYAFLWQQSIFKGYQDPQLSAELMKEWNLPAAPRHYVMSRAGAPGMQRLGAGMWSGDTGRNMGTLRAQINSQMHISMAGLDYYSSDAGGFTTTNGVGIEPGHSDDELYTQWFATSAWEDFPLKPHGWAYGAEETRYGPDQRGHLASNRANVIQRYELGPYLYSLGHRAFQLGEPIVPPLVYHFPWDLSVRSLGNVKMLGPSLLFAVVANFGELERRVYLPQGVWINYHSNEWLDSPGAETEPLPVYRNRGGGRGLFTLPAFARAGAILPKQHVDSRTMNFSGRRTDGSVRDELIVRIYADQKPSQFTLFEDDGETVAYQAGAVRQTLLSQRLVGEQATVVIDASSGTYAGASSARDGIIELVTRDRRATSVSVNGVGLKECLTRADFDSGAAPCWHGAGANLILARSGRMGVDQARTFVFELEPVSPVTSAHFVCENGRTQPGEAVYVLGSAPELGAWDPAHAVRLEATRYPRWSGVIAGLPSRADLEWKCVKRSEAGGGGVLAQGANSRVHTPESGYAGSTHGGF